MNPLQLLVPFLLATTSVSAALAQPTQDTAAHGTGFPTVAFLDAGGAPVYRIRHDASLDAEGMQRALWIAELYQRFTARAGTDETAARKMKTMEARWAGLGVGNGSKAGTSASPAQQAAAPRATQGKYVIEGDFSKSLASGSFVLFQTPKKTESKGSSSMAPASMAPATMGASSSAPSDLVPGEIGRVELVGGRFTIEGEVDEVRPVYFYVLNAKTPEGRTMGATKGQGFILEPGTLTLTMNDNHKHMVTGGFFNEGVYGPWLKSTAYQDLQAMIPLAFGSLPGETEEEKEPYDRIGMAVHQAMMDAETAGRRDVALRHPDLLVRQLAIETAWLGGSWMLDGARGILALDPENEWANDFAAREAARQGKAASHVQAAHVGGRYLPFTADSLDGEAISLSKTCAQNKYVLLEFWASWCGPCRAEIPHMKEAYAHYHELGFEIFGYTLDDEQSAWEKASQEEELPWINTGLGAKSDPVQLYSVTGVPANYLINGSTGKVVARDLRGDKLEEKLQELLGQSSTQGK